MGIKTPGEQSELDGLLERAQVILDAEKSAILQKSARIILEKTGDAPMTASYEEITRMPYEAGQRIYDHILTAEQADEMNADIKECERCIREKVQSDPENTLFIALDIPDEDESDEEEDVSSITLSGSLDKKWAEEQGMFPAVELNAQLIIGEDITEREVEILKFDSCLAAAREISDFPENEWKNRSLAKVQTKLATLLTLFEG